MTLVDCLSEIDAAGVFCISGRIDASRVCAILIGMSALGVTVVIVTTLIHDRMH